MHVRCACALSILFIVRLFNWRDGSGGIHSFEADKRRNAGHRLPAAACHIETQTLSWHQFPAWQFGSNLGKSALEGSRSFAIRRWRHGWSDHVKSCEIV